MSSYVRFGNQAESSWYQSLRRLPLHVCFQLRQLGCHNGPQDPDPLRVTWQYYAIDISFIGVACSSRSYQASMYVGSTSFATGI